MKATERSTEFIATETVISFAEYLLLLCRTLEAVEQNENEDATKITNEYVVA